MADLFITAGSVQNPYKQFPLTIAANATERIQYDYNFFRVLSASANTFAVRFGQSGAESDVIGAGVGYELPEVVRDVFIRNLSGSSITLTVAMAIGKIYDDRLNVSGNINAVTVTPTTLVSAADASVAATTTTQVVTSDANNKSVAISNLVANATKIRVGDSSTGAAQGAEVPIGGTFVVDNTADIYVYNPSGSTINVGLLFSRT